MHFKFQLDVYHNKNQALRKTSGKNSLLLILGLLLSLSAHAGPFPPAAGLPGSTAIAADNPAIVGWATSYSDYTIGANVDVQFQTPSSALGPAGNSDGNNSGYVFDIVSLGDNGSISLSFAEPITNGDGADFLVFENSFSDSFLELAFVEVSSNGSDFVRFDNISLSPAAVGAFGNIDTTNILGYGGKYRSGFGTPFDLQDLESKASNHPSLNINYITHVRIVDINGNGTHFDSLPAPAGPNPIYDPYPSSGSAGFDLDAVAVMHFYQQDFEANVPLPLSSLIILSLMLINISYLRARKKS
tara:strand:+ start:2044 stop:2946 length:903 start_codon:yes stop_codon:yes gene_type:complete